MRYVQAINTGKGFITHADRLLLSFTGKAGDIWEVDGTVANVDAWIMRVGGVEKTGQESIDVQFGVTRYHFTAKEFLLEILTTNEFKFLMDRYATNVKVKALLDHIFDNNGIDVGSPKFLTFLEGIRDAGYLTQARLDVIILGRTI